MAAKKTVKGRVKVKPATRVRAKKTVRAKPKARARADARVSARKPVAFYRQPMQMLSNGFDSIVNFFK